MTSEILIPGGPEWIERHRSVVSASEMGCLLGLKAYGGRTRSDLKFAKRYGTEVTTRDNPSMLMGRRLEPLILDDAEQRLGRIIDRQLWVVRGRIAATLDGRVESTGDPVEAKTSGIIFRAPDGDEWGGDGSDEVPSGYLTQVMTQMFVCGADAGHLQAWIGGRGPAFFQFASNADLFALFERLASEFFERLWIDEPDLPPPQLETLKRLRRQPNKVLPRSDAFEELRDRFESAKASAKATDEAKELAQRELLAAMGDCDAAECSGGRYTFSEQTTHYKAKPLATETTFRVLRFRKGG